MLQLTRADLGITSAAQAGVRIWWPTLPGRKRKSTALAWGNLLILDPLFRWPQPIAREIERQSRWGETGFRIVWHPELARLLIEREVPVPDFSALIALPMRATSPLQAMIPRKRARYTRLETREGTGYYVWQRDVQRITAALERERSEIQWRNYLPPGDVPSMVLAYRSDALRAVVTALPEDEVIT